MTDIPFHTTTISLPYLTPTLLTQTDPTQTDPTQTDPTSLDPASTDVTVDEGAMGLSPDSLMAYCQSRLDSIGDQVQTSFAEQQQSQSEMALIQGVANQFKNYSGAQQTDPKTIAEMETSLGNVIATIQGTDPTSAALPTLIQTYNNLVWSGSGGTTGPQFIDEGAYPPDTSSPQGDNILGITEIQGYAQNLTDAAGDLNSNSELQMIQLESLMSQRQTAITLTTNLVQSLGDQENKIADNIGH